MPKKSKKGKNRLDVFYRKAKEAGYRARSAYKLIHLNTKYEFLQKSRVCIDLCAAPGSWMQVARKYMPVSSIVVGVDLVPIKAIPNTLTITGDITTEKVRQELKSTLKTWKADVVLHDGAPNVGQNWLHDAYQQNLLVLHSFKLACEFLMKGGIFVTKVFRSKDYFQLEYIFRKLFKKVEATKPQASRHESAEIFVVCLGYLAPSKIDPQFFDAKHVFQEVDEEPSNKINILKPEKVKKKAEGFQEGATILYKEVPVSQFINSTKYVEALEEASAFIFDNDWIKNHKRTTIDVIESCKDLKVCGRRELKLLLSWRKFLKAELDAIAEKSKPVDEKESTKSDAEDELDLEEKELEKVQEQINELKREKLQYEKRVQKNSQKVKKKLEERLRLKTLIPGDEGPTEAPTKGLFSLKLLDKVKALDSVVDQVADQILESSDDEEIEPVKRVQFERHNEDTRLDKSGRYYKATDEISDSEEDSSSDIDPDGLGLKVDKKQLFKENDDDSDLDEPFYLNPIVTDLVGDDKDEKKARKAENWFNKDIFKDLEIEEDEDFDIDSAIKHHVKKGGTIVSKKENKISNDVGSESGYTTGHSDIEKAVDAPDTSDSGSDSDSDIETQIGPQLIGGAIGAGMTAELNLKKGKKRKKEKGLGAVGLALATQMIHSKKAKRDMMDAAWNRYMFGDEDDVPQWFAEDEKKHNTLPIDVDKDDLNMYKDRLKGVDVRSIKKVVEAKARKQRRLKSRLDRARKKSEVVTNTEDMSLREKALEVKKLYKSALAPLKKKDTKYIVMKKSMKGRKPGGIKGPWKMVDKRMKKEARATKRIEKLKKGKKT